MTAAQIRIASALWLAVASGGLIIMASAFVVLYAVQGLGCAQGWDSVTLARSNLLSLTLFVSWFVHLVAHGAFQWFAHGLWARASGPDDDAARFLAAATCLIAALGLFSTAFIGFAVVFVPPCL